MHFLSTFYYLYMGCLKKGLCWRSLFSLEDFLKYDNTSFIISGHGGNSWRQSSKMTCLSNSDSLQCFVSDQTFTDCLKQIFFLVYFLTDILLTGNSCNPSFSSKLTYCFQFHSYLDIYYLWHHPFSSECQSRWWILVSF